MTRILNAVRRWLRNRSAILGAKAGSALGALTFIGTLRARVCRYVAYVPNVGLAFNHWEPARFLSARVVTDAGVAFLVDDWDSNAQDITNFNFHDSGTGTTAEAAADTDLVTPAGPTTRATGTKSQPAANQIRSVGLITYAGTLAITEHGLFNQSARGGGSVLWDRSVFTAINVVANDKIEFTYTLTVQSGG